jgi:hypothetical protein
MTLVVRDEADIVDAQLAYHLNAGVDFVLATDHASSDGTTEILESYERAGYLRLFREQGEMRESDWRTRMARLAATEHGAHWVLNTDADEFWWPRAESLKEVLLPIPARYTVVQGLVRLFLPRPENGFFADRMTVRRPVLSVAGARREPLERLLRPAHRADPGVVLGDGREVGGMRVVPLRAWYPLEVLSFPVRSRAQAERARGAVANVSGETVVDDATLAEELADESLVVDMRLADALRALGWEGSSAPGPSDAFVVRPNEASPLELGAPSIVEDAAYAVECADVGEVDITELERHVEALEQRVAWLEEGLGPRVLRVLSRIAHPRRRPTDS